MGWCRTGAFQTLHLAEFIVSRTLTALTPGLLLQVNSENLKPLLESRPELVESLCDTATIPYSVLCRTEHGGLSEDAFCYAA